MKLERDFDTIVVPANEAGFQEEFIANNRWFAVRIDSMNLNAISYIAAYRTSPISAITHYAEVRKIEQYGQTGKHILHFTGHAKEIGPIKLGESRPIQGPRYTTLGNLLNAKKIIDLYPKKHQ